MDAFFGILLGVVLLVALVWYRSDAKHCPLWVKLLGPVAVALWLVQKMALSARSVGW